MDQAFSRKSYIAHFDMLGFKSATLRDPNKAWNALRNLRSRMDGMGRYGLWDVQKDRDIPRRIVTRIFSDTILAFTLGNEPDDLTALVLLTAQLFADCLSSCIPLRGGIAYGDFFVDEALQLYCGAPFVKAYELGEQSQWCGIILDEVVAEHFLNHAGGPLTTYNNSPTIIQWDVPIKASGRRTSWVVNWPVVFRAGFTKHPPLSVQEYYQAFESLLGSYESLSPDAKDKHNNTVEFINSQFK